ncbi:MAG: hypothetical protein IPJ77_19255 [Planctomycetes bacterium]|nr:hypothetical protein [Planctomycetota bacterium]
MPLDWDAVGADPNEKNLIVKYDPAGLKYIPMGASGHLFVHCWLLKFDRRKKPESDAGDEPRQDRSRRLAKDLAAWVKAERRAGIPPSRSHEGDGDSRRSRHDQEYLSSKVSGESSSTARCVYPNTSRTSRSPSSATDPPTRRSGPNGGQAFERHGEVVLLAQRRRQARRGRRHVEDDVPREAQSWRSKLRSKTRRWKLYGTENYFIISCNPDRAFIDELLGRLEAIRAIYEQDYPAAKIEELKKLAADLKTKEQARKRAKEDG